MKKFDMKNIFQKKEQNTNSQLVRFTPVNFKEAKSISNELIDGNVVYINVKNISAQEAARLLDFVSGVLYSINGKAKRVSSEAYLLAPNDELLNRFTNETN